MSLIVEFSHSLSHQQGGRRGSHEARPQGAEGHRGAHVLVRHAVLRAHLPGDLPAGVVAVVADGREKVMLHLGGKAKGHVEPEVGLAGEVHALGDLHLRPGLVPRMRAFISF